MEESKLPPGFDQAFILPTSDKDQHGNPVVTRDGSQYDPKTGYPHEIWLKEPRLELVLVPAGEFMMGSPDNEEGRHSDEGPVHQVRITKPFYMGKYEITNQGFRAFTSSHNSKDYEGKSLNGDGQPVVYVSWDDATKWCQWLTTRAGVEVRLPTEAEWEYACRAGTSTVRYWGNGLDPAYCNFADKNTSFSWREARLDDGQAVSGPVGSFRPNAFGLHDMLGNVWEWCLDGKRSYSSSPQSDPRGPESGSRVLRGGSWRNLSRLVRSAARNDDDPSYTFNYYGFRVCVSLRVSAR